LEWRGSKQFEVLMTWMVAADADRLQLAAIETRQQSLWNRRFILGS
jgi:hypothetical protein